MTSEHPVVQTLILVTALGCGLMAGVFYAFSGFVMSGLARVPGTEGIVAMQSINVTALRPPLMIPLLGTALTGVAVMVIALLNRDEYPVVLLLIAGAVYLLGAIALTRGYHVPRNEALDLLDPDSVEAAAYWKVYVAEWTRWNHVRSGACLVSAALFTIGFLRT